VTPAQLGLVILSAAEVPNFLAGMMPSLMTIRTFADDPEQLRALRRGEVVGSALSLGVGLGASLVADNPAPLLASAAVLAVLLYEYEKAMREPISNRRDLRTGQPLAAGAGESRRGR
jgi:hypothetical protein